MSKFGHLQCSRCKVIMEISNLEIVREKRPYTDLWQRERCEFFQSCLQFPKFHAGININSQKQVKKVFTELRLMIVSFIYLFFC